ncbi:MAG: hypothetical protein ACR2GU_01035 [Rubrobacteraceae bacterium]
MRGRHPNNEGIGKRLSSGEVEAVLRRAAELSSRRGERRSGEFGNVSPESLLQVATAAGIPEEYVRRAIEDLDAQEPAETATLATKLYGSARLRVVREIDSQAAVTREYLEYVLRRKQGLKLRHSTEEGSLWDSGDALGAVRRALDFSGQRTLLKTDEVELVVEEIGGGRCGANLTADATGQRGEYLSLGALVGATLALPVAIAGVQDPLFFLGILPALAVPGIGFKLAYDKARAEIRRTLNDLLDDAEDVSPDEEDDPESGDKRTPERPRNLKPIPKFDTRRRDE